LKLNTAVKTTSPPRLNLKFTAWTKKS
jgi:hypothetical protein